jgi:hypothetical protein
MPPDESDRDLEAPGTRGAGANPQSGAPPGEDHVQGGLHGSRDADDGDETFSGDTFDRDTMVRSPPPEGSLAARVDAYMAASDDDDDEGETGIRPAEMVMGPAGSTGPARPAAPGRAGDLELGPAGVTPPAGSRPGGPGRPMSEPVPVAIEADAGVHPGRAAGSRPEIRIPTRAESEPAEELSLDDVSEVRDFTADLPAVAPPPPPRPPAHPPIPRPGTIAAPPPIPRPPPRPPSGLSGSMPAIPHVRPVVTVPPLAPPPGADVPRPMASDPSIPLDLDDAEMIDSGIDLSPTDDGMAPASLEATVAPEIPLEHHLEVPTALDQVLAETGEAALEKRAADLARDLDNATDRATIAGLAYELGELYERRLADEARAVKAFGRALQTDPSLRPNLWAIRRVFYRRGLWPNLMKLVDAELRFARSDIERADLLTEKGLVLADKLIQPVEARAAFEQAAQLDPTALTPLIQLERLALVAGDEAALADVWGQLAAASRRPERKLVHLLDLIRLSTDAGGEAIERARDLVSEAVALGVDGERVAAERLRVAELSGDPEEVLAALEAQAALLLVRCGPAGMPEVPPHARAPGTPIDRATALRLRLVAVRRRQAQTARADGQGDRAWDYLQQALALAPGEPLLLAGLADLAEELGRYGELAELVESWQAMEGDPARAMTLSIRRADALLRGGQRDQARALIASLEAGAPGFLPITAIVERDALEAGDWASLARGLAAAAEAARAGATFGPGQPHDPDPVAAAALYVASAEAWACAPLPPPPPVAPEGEAAAPPPPPPVDSDAEARAALGHALELVGGYPPATWALIELHAGAGRVDDAAAVLEHEAHSADPDARSAALERLARLLRDAGRGADAVAVERRLLAESPDDVRLAWRVDIGLAELGLTAERAAHLAAIAARDPDPARRGIALATAARLAEAAGDPGKAIELYRATLGVWPGDRYARAALTELLRAEGRWDELAQARRAEAAELADGPGAIRALREAAAVLEDRLGRPAEAAAVYRDLLDRAPDDPHALLGRVRAAAAADDRDDLVAALDARLDAASGPASVNAALELAFAQERAGHLDDALDAHRRARAAVAEGARTVGSALAAASMVDLAVARGDTAARVEAMADLASATTDPELAAALYEDVGWLHALVLEDFDQAATAFASAIERSGDQHGALLGAALIAARQGEAAELSAAYERLAAAALAPDAAVALHLRAAAMASAAGDTDEAAARVAAARAASADDVGALVVTAEHAPPATPPGPGDDPTAAVDQLLARAEVLAMRAAMADDPAARASWELDRAEALECAGRLKEAGEVVTAVLADDPEDLRALEALRRLARRGGDRPTWARASLALATRIGDGAARLALLREAAAIFDPAGRPEGAELAAAERADGSPAGADGADPAAAVAVYRRILGVDAGAPEFERLCQIARQHGDVREVALAIADRLAWIDGGAAEPAAAVPLLLERARLRSAIGDARAAVADLEDLIARDPGHADGLGLLADLTLGLGDAEGAAELLRRYLAVETDPARRAEAELTLSKILAENMDDVVGAIEQLERVIATAPADAAHRERLVGLATRAGDWTRVERELREIARLRPSAGERARDEVRLAEVLRDKVGDAAGARAALERARQQDPLSIDVVRALRELVAPSERPHLLAGATDAVRVAIAAAPGRGPLYERLATVCGWNGDSDGRWLALAALEAIGTVPAADRADLAAGRKAAPAISRQRLDTGRREVLRPKELAGVVGDIWRIVAPSVTQAAGLDAAKLGFGRGDRVAMKIVAKKHEAVAAALAAMAVGDADVYISPSRSGFARVLATETPTLCLGADIAAGETPAARFQLGRAAMLAAERGGTLSELREGEAAWYVAAALRAAGLELPPALAEAVAADDTPVAERTRTLGKALGRRDKKALTQLGGRLGELAKATDVATWRRAAASAGQRAGLLLCGDLAVALALLDVGRGGRALSESPAALDLCAWSVSAAHATLRRDLGYAVGGGR